MEVEHALSSADPNASLRSLILQPWLEACEEEENKQKHQSVVTAVAQADGDSSNISNSQSARLDRLESDVAEIKKLLLNLQPSQMDTSDMREHHAESDV